MSELAPFVSLTPSGLLGLVVVMMMFGWLVPVRIMRGRLADKDMTIAQQKQTIAVLKANNAKLLRSQDVTSQVLDALPGAMTEVQGGDPNAEMV